MSTLFKKQLNKEEMRMVSGGLVAPILKTGGGCGGPTTGRES